jgi:2-oxoglutarate dehydrogenase E2 component (dihydrolipoamide succinyltransferase)
MAATLDICAPADQTEGTRSQVLRWLKAVGDTVTQHEPLIELETDKVTVEVAAPASGVLREIVKAEQEEIAPGEVLGRLETADDSERAAGASEVADAVRTRNAAHHAPAASAAAVEGEGAKAPASAAVANDGPVAVSGAAQRLSPAVRRLLQERGLDPSVIQGSGEGGRITIDDVIAHAPSTPTKAASAPSAQAKGNVTSRPQAPPGHVPARAPAPAGTRSHSVQHSAVRKRIADHMVQSLLQTAPHVTTVFEADLSAVMAHRSTHRADFQQRGAPLTFTAYFLAAIVDAIKAVPEANSRWTDTALEIYDDIHIGVATAVEGTGLVVPVVRDVQSLDLFGIASRLDQLVIAAREGRLTPADVRGGTFTISNHGVSGSLLATPIVINQPQSAILGVGKVEKRAVVIEHGDEEKVAVRPKCYVTLTIDHRVMDGHQANRFLQTFVRRLEAWPRDA